jgi:hypothetical protein
MGRLQALFEEHWLESLAGHRSAEYDFPELLDWLQYLAVEVVQRSECTE